MGRVLVVYATKSGCTEGIADRIAQTLGDAGATVEVLAAEDAGDPAGFDAVVVGSGVRAGQWHQSARSWVETHAKSLGEVPVAFFTCGLTMAEGPEKAGEVRAYTDPILEATGIEPVDIGLFAGWFEPRRFSFAERTILKMMKSPQGDLRDWDAIESWASAMGTRLGVAA